MKTAFFGSGDIGATVLRALLDAGRAPELVVTQPPRRRRRRGHAEPTPVHQVAESAGIAVATPADVNEADALDGLRACGADLFLVAEYGQILRQPLLDIPPLGSLNVHTSLLPRWRGAAPVAAAILAGDSETGVTIQRVVRKLDAGPVLARRATPIGPDDDRGTLSARLARMGGELLVEVVEAFAAGRPPAEEPQDEAAVTVCRRLRREDTAIDWTLEAEHLGRMVRAYRPRPGARAVLAREPELPLQVRRAEAVDGPGEPGVVAEVASGHFEVGAGAGRLRILEVVPAARNPMSARAFLNGYRLTTGERFR